MTTLIIYALVVLVATAVVWQGSTMLEMASERLAIYYGLPDIVTGAIVVAIGSSFPELSTTVISTLVHGEFELGVSAIVGSAIFNILVIPGLSGLVGDGPLEANRDLVYKEAQFYMLAVAVMIITFALAAIYQPVPTDTASIFGEMDRTLAAIPVIMYGLYVFVQWQDTMDLDLDAEPNEVKPTKEWFRLIASMGLIALGVEGLVRAAITFGRVLETDSYFWGVTVVAAGTSIPDAFVSVRAARRGKAVTSLANVLGSNVFDLLVAIPAGVLIAGAAVINFSVATPMMGVLTIATLILFLAMRTDMHLSRRESWFLLLLYAAFVTWMALESFGVVDTVHGLPPQKA